MISPTLCETIKPEQLPYRDYVAELKYDGRRAFLIKRGGVVFVVGREGNTITGKFPEIAAVGRELPDNTTIDGEIIVGNDFNALQRHDLNDKPAEFVAFDIVEKEGKDLTRLPLTERRRILEDVAYASGEKFCLSCQSNNQLELWDYALKEQLEGIVLKAPNSPYVGRRTDLWVKVKRMHEVVVQATGYSSDKREVSALETPSGKVNVAAPADQIEVKKAFAEGKKVFAEVEHMGLTKAGKMRQPVMKRLIVCGGDHNLFKEACGKCGAKGYCEKESMTEFARANK